MANIREAKYLITFKDAETEHSMKEHNSQQTRTGFAQLHIQAEPMLSTSATMMLLLVGLMIPLPCPLEITEPSRSTVWEMAEHVSIKFKANVELQPFQSPMQQLRALLMSNTLNSVLMI